MPCRLFSEVGFGDNSIEFEYNNAAGTIDAYLPNHRTTIEAKARENSDQCLPRHRHQEFLRFLRTVEKQCDPELNLHFILDNYATHKHARVKNWLDRHPRVRFHFVPTSSSWLNLVERFFSELT